MLPLVGSAASFLVVLVCAAASTLYACEVTPALLENIPSRCEVHLVYVPGFLPFSVLFQRNLMIFKQYRAESVGKLCHLRREVIDGAATLSGTLPGILGGGAVRITCSGRSAVQFLGY